MPYQRILLVEDEQLTLAGLSEGLREHGYEVFEASTAQQAMNVAEEHQPDLAILDMRLTDGSGLDVARWLKAHTETPFIFLSAYSEDDLVCQAVGAGAMGYLVKPLLAQQLIPVIHSATERARELNDLSLTTERLKAALESDRSVAQAVGLLMERYHLDERSAFDRLRAYARSQRRKVHEVAEEILKGHELIARIGRD